MNSEYPNQEVANINTFRKRKDQTYYLLQSFFRCSLIFHNDLHICNKLSNKSSIPSNRVYKAQKPWNSFFIFSFSHTFCIACGKQTRKKRQKTKNECQEWKRKKSRNKNHERNLQWNESCDKSSSQKQLLGAGPDNWYQLAPIVLAFLSCALPTFVVVVAAVVGGGFLSRLSTSWQLT